MYRCCWLLIKIIIIICDLLPFINICTVHEYIKKPCCRSDSHVLESKEEKIGGPAWLKTQNYGPNRAFFKKNLLVFQHILVQLQYSIEN